MDPALKAALGDELRGLLLACYASCQERLGGKPAEGIQYMAIGRDMLDIMVRGQRYLDKVIAAATPPIATQPPPPTDKKGVGSK